MSDKKANLTIIIDEKTRDELHQLVPHGEVSKFVYLLIKKELDRIKKETATEYQQFAQDPAITKQVKNWDISSLHSKLHDRKKS